MALTMSGGTSASGNISLVRRITDQQVLDQLLSTEALTRAEIAARTGISKPTVSESVRRLITTGLLVESGMQSGKRGPAGTYYAVRTDNGIALVMSAGPDGVVVESYDARGFMINSVRRSVAAPISAQTLDDVVIDAVTETLAQAPGPVLGCTLSVAGPVDQGTGHLVEMADAPFLLNEFRPRELLADHVETTVFVDNDVNWAALAEHHEGNAQDLDNFLSCYLGPGIGSAVMINGEIYHGARGIAGELAQVRTVGPEGRSMRLVECFAGWGLVHPGTKAINVERVVDVLTSGSPSAQGIREGIIVAVAAAISSVTALLDPAGVIISGPWGSADGFRDAVAERIETCSPYDLDLRLSTLDHEAPLRGARISALRLAYDSMINKL